MEEKKKEENNPEEKKTFVQKYALLILFLGVALFFTIMKLIGFPEILNK
jgi:hypothetical protein